MNAPTPIPREEILHGRTLPLMLRLGWPVMLSSLLDTMYQLTDTFWLGRLAGIESGTAVASLQVAFPFLWFLVAFFADFSVAGTALVSQHTGAGDKRTANEAAGQVLSVVIIGGTLAAIAGMLIFPFIMPLITDDAAIRDTARSYLLWYLPGLPFVFITAVFRVLMAAAGNTFTPLLVVFTGNAINMALDPLFILGFGPVPAMGVQGAALATVISSFIAGLIALRLLMNGRNAIHLTFGDLVPRLHWIRRILKIGLPAAVGDSAEALGFVVLMALIGRVENAREALGGYGIGNRLTSLIAIAIVGLGQGLSTIIGQNLGASRFDKARGAAGQGIAVLFGVLLIETGLIILFREPLVRLFIPNDPGVIAEASRFLLYFGSSVPLFGLIRGITASFNAAGRNGPVLIIGLLRLWILRLPLAWLFAFGLGYGTPGLWFGMALSNLGAAIAAIVFFIRFDWKKNLVEANAAPGEQAPE